MASSLNKLVCLRRRVHRKPEEHGIQHIPGALSGCLKANVQPLQEAQHSHLISIRDLIEVVEVDMSWLGWEAFERRLPEVVRPLSLQHHSPGDFSGPEKSPQFSALTRVFLAVPQVRDLRRLVHTARGDTDPIYEPANVGRGNRLVR